MRKLVCFVLAALAFGLGVGRVQAAPGNPPAWNGVASPARPATAADYHYFDDRRACPYGFHYVCFFEPNGRRSCACRLGGDRPACPEGYYFDCRYQPNGLPNCACY